ncbi:MAG: NUDIX hydrolase [Bacteroidetes bacterium]|nr:NUDIX hydrolase [Bacteroidota bacterium]MBU1422952.1 NUDIX hydrolase [Bacteroidota bacterium]MBU2471093.1 NUDIX hydrolase [Bacteroidota bacterium]MBU2635605.1 NUDIX hydrolase [Bacteroidota bacterium]
MELKLLKRNIIYNGKVFNVIVDDVEYESGNYLIREVAEHSGGAVIFAVFPDEKIILIRQHRYPINKFIYELPAGKLNPNEDPLDCAKREFEEETGYKANKWQKLTAIYTTPGFCSEQLHIYMAQDLYPAENGRNLEEGELTMTVEILPLEKVIEMIKNQEIVDGKTISGVMVGKMRLEKK